jgi:hypothetical protein
MTWREVPARPCSAGFILLTTGGTVLATLGAVVPVATFAIAAVVGARIVDNLLPALKVGRCLLTGARAKAWCLLVYAEASFCLSRCKLKSVDTRAETACVSG